MKLKLPYGNTQENNSLLLPEGMITVDIEKKAIRIHDGITQGGYEMVGQQAFVPAAGETWSLINYGVARYAGCIEYYDGSVFVGPDNAGSTVRLYRSTDLGNNWTAIDPDPGLSKAVRSLVKNGTTILIGGTGGSMWISTDDGVSWAQVAAPVATYNHVKLLYFKGLYVALSATTSSRLTTSPDGVNWTSRNSMASLVMYAMAASANTIIAVGAAGNARRSSDGITWTSFTIPGFVAGQYCYGITYDNGMFVVTGSDGKIRYSVDEGVNWLTPTITGIPTSQALRAVGYTGSAWLFAGDADSLYMVADMASAATAIDTTFTAGSTSLQRLTRAGSKMFLGTNDTSQGLFRSPA